MGPNPIRLVSLQEFRKQTRTRGHGVSQPSAAERGLRRGRPAMPARDLQPWDSEEQTSAAAATWPVASGGRDRSAGHTNTSPQVPSHPWGLPSPLGSPGSPCSWPRRPGPTSCRSRSEDTRVWYRGSCCPDGRAVGTVQSLSSLGMLPGHTGVAWPVPRGGHGTKCSRPQGTKLVTTAPRKTQQPGGARGAGSLAHTQLQADGPPARRLHARLGPQSFQKSHQGGQVGAGAASPHGPCLGDPDTSVAVLGPPHRRDAFPQVTPAPSQALTSPVRRCT